MRVLLAALVAVAALPVLAGYPGALHPAADSLGVFRAPGAVLVGLLALGALAAGARWAGAAGLGLAAIAGLPLVAAYLAGGAAGPLRLYQKNMLFRNAELAGLEADIRAAAPDAVTLQEVSRANRALLQGLADLLPHQLTCRFPGTVGDVAVLTRLPPVPGQEVCAPGLAALQVEGPGGPVWLVSVHLHWPWPYRQPGHVADLLPVLEGLQGPVVMAGDFNMVRWSHAWRAMAAAARSAGVGPVRGTYLGFAPWLVLPIDHVLAPGGGRVETRAALGSDHLGLLAEVTP